MKSKMIVAATAALLIAAAASPASAQRFRHHGWHGGHHWHGGYHRGWRGGWARPFGAGLFAAGLFGAPALFGAPWGGYAYDDYYYRRPIVSVGGCGYDYGW